METNTPKTGAGETAAQKSNCVVTAIEWPFGFGEKFLGTVAEAVRHIFRESQVENDTMQRRTEWGYDLFEWRICPHGEDWAFIGRIYTK
jgi:hypothetical protein